MTTFVDVDRARRKCEREHLQNGGRWAAVLMESGEIIVRCEDKAQRIVRKHPRCEIVCSVPEAMEVTP